MRIMTIKPNVIIIILQPIIISSSFSLFLSSSEAGKGISILLIDLLKIISNGDKAFST